MRGMSYYVMSKIFTGTGDRQTGDRDVRNWNFPE